MKKWKESVICSIIQLIAISWTVAHQAPLSMEFSRWEYCSVLPFPSPGDLSDLHEHRQYIWESSEFCGWHESTAHMGCLTSALLHSEANILSLGRGNTHLKGHQNKVGSDPQGFCLNNLGSDPTPDRAVMTIAQGGIPCSHPAPALAPPCPAQSSTKMRAPSIPSRKIWHILMSNPAHPSKDLCRCSLHAEAPR